MAEDELFNMRPRKVGVQYICPWEEFKRPGMRALFKWKFQTPDNTNIPSDQRELDKILPVLPVDSEKLKSVSAEKMQVTWIGHATVLVQFDGISILTDPVLETFCGPEITNKLQMSYKRYREAACDVKDIPKIDAVLISHNHYDHLETKAVQKINEKFADVKWFVAEGTKNWFIATGCKKENIYELTWWEERIVEIDGKKFTFICTPCQHWCQRGIMDMNKCLWCAWAVKGPGHSFFFAGDTGYPTAAPVFETIGKKYGPFSLAAIPIGAYEPRFVMQYQHCDPEEAVKIHKDVRSEQSVGVHWGTFALTNEFYLEPPNKLREAMKKEGLEVEKFCSLQHGETWVVGETRPDPPFMNKMK